MYPNGGLNQRVIIFLVIICPVQKCTTQNKPDAILALTCNRFTKRVREGGARSGGLTTESGIRKTLLNFWFGH